MNPTSVEEAISLAKAIADGKGSSKAQVAICTPHPFLAACKPHLEKGGIDLGAQACYFEQKGAYTGATSTSMIRSVGAKHVIVGHSERRTVFHQTDEMVNQIIHKVLSDNMLPILCVGETKARMEEYESGLNTQICAIQLAKGLKGVSKEDAKKVTIAYEPVWAIGTGLVCDASVAQ
eukprot:514352-Hanusia_phi.AAC.1